MDPDNRQRFPPHHHCPSAIVPATIGHGDNGGDSTSEWRRKEDLERHRTGLTLAGSVTDLTLKSDMEMSSKSVWVWKEHTHTQTHTLDYLYGF